MDTKEKKMFPWGHLKRYNDFASAFRKEFKERIQKVSADAGFTCPNRDGTKGTGGCIYCNNVAFNPYYCRNDKSVTVQIEEGIAFFSRKYKSMRFLAYFQSYSNTYGPLSRLEKLYKEALAHPKIVGLVIGTRPDCLEPDTLDYLEDLSKKVYLMVELGVESHLDKTLERVNRCHNFEDSVVALEEIRKRKIRSCAHMILGLPGESRSDFLDQARIVSRLPVDNLKLHQLQIHKDTVLESQFRESPESFHLFSQKEYIELIVDYLELLNPAIVVERFVSQAPGDLLVAPRWGPKNFEFVAKVEKSLKERNTWQGRLFDAMIQ